MTIVDSAQSHAAKPRLATALSSRQLKAAPNKSDIVAKLLARPKGATVAEVSVATGWQARSVRAFFSGLRKKGSALEREARKDGTASYRLMLAGVKPSTPATTNATAESASASDEGAAAVTGATA